LLHITRNYSTAQKCGTLPARKWGTLHETIHRYTSVAHHLKLNHPKAMLVQWTRFKSGTSQIQAQRVTTMPVLWATVVQGTSLLVFNFFLVNSRWMALLLMFGPSVSLLAWHSHAQKEVQGNTRAILNSSVHEINEYYVSRFIFYFTVDIMPFLKHTEIISEGNDRFVIIQFFGLCPPLSVFNTNNWSSSNDRSKLNFRRVVLNFMTLNTEWSTGSKQ